MRRPLLILLALLALWALLAPTAFGQESGPARWSSLADLAFQRIPTETGAPNSLGPSAIAEDAQGFLWIGTQNGLVRFDGYRFRTYRASPKSPNALPDAFVQHLHVDRRGRLWIGTLSMGLARYRADSDDFQRYPPGPQGLAHPNVTALADAADGGLWIGTDGGLDHLDADGQAITHHRIDVPGLRGERVTALLASRDGELWIGTGAGLVRADAAAGRLRVQPLPGAPDNPAVVNALFEDADGRIWAGTADRGAFVVEPGSGTVALLHADEGGAAPPPINPVSEITQSATGEVWIATKDRGILVVEPRTLRARRVVRDPLVAGALDSDTIWAVKRDRSGLMWIGTNRSLMRHDPGTAALLTLVGAPGRRGGLSGDDADSVLVLPDGRVWVSTGPGSIDVFEPARGRVLHIAADSRRPADALPESSIYAMLLHEDGWVYVGSERGLYRVDRAGRRVERVVLPGRKPAETVWALHQDERGLWVGGRDGLWLLPRGGAPGLRLEEFRSAMRDQRISLFHPAPGGRLWVATRSGMLLLDPAQRRAQPFPADAARIPELEGALVNALLTDARQRLWIGTSSAGIVVVDDPLGASPRLQVIGAAQGLPNLNVSRLLADQRGRIWASTDEGLAVVDPQRLEARALGAADGLQVTTYWAYSGAATPEGELLFGGVGGLTVVRPELLRDWHYQPPVVATELRLDGAPLPPGALRRSGDAATLKLPPGTRSLAVEFSALDFSAPERNRYAYRLAGFDADWVPTDSTRRLAVYTHLPPGEHLLEVRGSNREGAWAPQPLRITLQVQPAWHQTLAFRLLLAALALAALFALVQARTLLLRRRQRLLEQQVAERTAALEQRSVELQESQRRLAEMAYSDMLTGLPNRRMFGELFEQLARLMRRQGGGFALLLVDLDRFKHINDTLGHAAGDALLVAAAARLRTAVRESDTVARVGGDEFALLLSGLQDAAQVAASCQRIIEAFAAPVDYEGVPMATSPSIGVAFFPRDGTALDALYLAADAALYRAKAAGRNTWRCHAPG